jgi:hypothetical protein
MGRKLSEIFDIPLYSQRQVSIVHIIPEIGIGIHRLEGFRGT